MNPRLSPPYLVELIEKYKELLKGQNSGKNLSIAKNDEEINFLKVEISK